MGKPRIAFFGLGIMGGGMARRLLAHGFSVTVYNRSVGKAKPFADAGARVAGSPRVAAENAEVIISMVADDIASRGMWLGEMAPSPPRNPAHCASSAARSPSAGCANWPPPLPRAAANSSTRR